MSLTLSKTKIGPLDCNVLRPQKGDETRAVVLFHGYGADYNDLAPLPEYMDTPDDICWVFPNGILDTLIGPGVSGRAWFNIDVAALEQAMRTGTHRNLSQIRPQGLNHAMSQARKFYQELGRYYDQVILGGFSQGAMLATELSLSCEKKPEALIVLSGTLLDSTNWAKLITESPKLPVFQSHGINDPLLSFAAAKDLKAQFEQAGFGLDFYEFSGGHEIPPHILKKLGLFIDKHLRTPKS